MLTHYLSVSWRNILRHKFYSIILVVGLAIGIASSLLLGMYTWSELTYDDFHDKKDRIYLIGVREKDGQNEGEGGWTTPPTGPALKEYFAEIEESVRLCFWFDDVLVSRGEKIYAEKNIIGADSSFFKIFTAQLVSGDPATALTEPNSIVITEKIAKKYFGDEEPLGKTLHFEQFFQECKVTAVIKDWPSNSHFNMDILLSLSSLRAINFDFNHWKNHTFCTYVLLDEAAKQSQIESKLPQFVEKSLSPYLIQRYQKSYQEMYRGGDYYRLFLMPLKDVHLSTMVFENREGRNILTYALGGMAIMILLLVAINYINLATILTFSRTKEVGIRKSAGSNSQSLFRQFLVESIVLVFIGLLLAIGLIELGLPHFNNLIQKQLTFHYTEPKVVFGLAAFALALGIIVGVYPAFRFANMNAIRALKGNVLLKNNNPWLRNSLVIFQFTVCFIMIVSTLVVFKQLAFMTSKSLGFSKDQVLVIKRAYGLKNNKTSLKNELLKHQSIKSASYTATTPGREFDGHGQHFVGTAADQLPTIYPILADEDILETLDLKITHGNSFKDFPQKNEKAILNEAAVELMKFESPLDQTIDKGTLGRKDVSIIGVVKDFHFKSFHFNIEPLVIYHLDINNDTQNNANFLLVKMDARDIPSTLEYIQTTWDKFANNYPFEYSFLDEDFKKLFERETTMTQVYTIFSVISISIACLGLLGLASFSVTKRTKEIGIRKIVGASFFNITGILSRDFFRWIIIAIVIGSGLSWYLMHEWLQNFAYQTPLDWWLFLMGGACVMLIAVLTVSWHLYKAATRKAIETLRYE